MTRPGGRSVLALALAAVIGISGGTLTAFVSHDEEPPPRPRDPLALGIPLVNIDCTDEAILIVGRGNTAGDLRTSVVDFKKLGARYLEPAESCQTAYPPYEGEQATYAVYLSGYDGMGEACADRMRNDHRNDMVTVMNDGNTDAVMCPCEMARDDLPEIGGEGEDITTESAMWTRMYQQMLAAAGFMKQKHVTGVFDGKTLYKTRVLQTGSELPADEAKVTTDTWVALRDKACRTYDYYPSREEPA